jgi:hypothetical protein
MLKEKGGMDAALAEWGWPASRDNLGLSSDSISIEHAGERLPLSSRLPRQQI